MIPWRTIEQVSTDEGTMTLLSRGAGDFLIKLDDYVLMNSRLSLSEQLLARKACELLSAPAPSVLLGGLGMGCTLRAALDTLPRGARVVVAELNEVVLRWCRGPLHDLTGGAVDDPRVQVQLCDVALKIRQASSPHGRHDAIILDLYHGTHDANSEPDHPFYGRAALQRVRRALSRDGVFAAWTEERDVGFERRLEAAGFTLESPLLARGGPRHVVYLART